MSAAAPGPLSPKESSEMLSPSKIFVLQQKATEIWVSLQNVSREDTLDRIVANALPALEQVHSFATTIKTASCNAGLPRSHRTLLLDNAVALLGTAERFGEAVRKVGQLPSHTAHEAVLQAIRDIIGLLRAFVEDDRLADVPDALQLPVVDTPPPAGASPAPPAERPRVRSYLLPKDVAASVDAGSEGEAPPPPEDQWAEDPDDVAPPSEDPDMIDDGSQLSDTSSEGSDELGIGIKIKKTTTVDKKDHILDFTRLLGAQAVEELHQAGEDIPMPPPPPPEDWLDDDDSIPEPLPYENDDDELWDSDDFDSDYDDYDDDEYDDDQDVADDDDGHPAAHDAAASAIPSTTQAQIEAPTIAELKEMADKLESLGCSLADKDNLGHVKRYISLLQASQKHLRTFTSAVNIYLPTLRTNKMLVLRVMFAAQRLSDAATQMFASTRALSNMLENEPANLQTAAALDALKSATAEFIDVFTVYDLQRDEARAAAAASREAGQDEYYVQFWQEGPDRADNILYGDNFVEGAFREIEGGTFNKLVERLTHDRIADLMFVNSFIITYRSFCSPHELLAKLIERFHVPRRRLPKAIAYEDWKQTSVVPIQLRVCSSIKLWLESRSEDFDETLLERLTEFVEESVEPEHTLLARQLKNAMKRQRDITETWKLYVFDDRAAKIPEKGIMPIDVFAASPPEAIAQALTAVDFMLFAAIQPVELLDQAWNKAKLKHRAPNVLALINRFNSISAWVANLVLWHETLKDRARVMAKLIKIGVELRRLNNFNSVAALSAGLSISAVHRLKHTKDALGKQTRELKAELDALVVPDGSYKAYRDAIHAVNPPAVPFLGVYLRDLVFIEDGNPNLTGDLINFQKRRLVHNVILEIQQYQQVKYEFGPLPPRLMMFCRLLAVNTDDECYERSLVLEPRDASKEDVLARQLQRQPSAGEFPSLRQSKSSRSILEQIEASI